MNRKSSLLVAMIIGQGLSGAGYASSSSHDMPYHADSSFDTASEAAANNTPPQAAANNTPPQESPPRKAPLPYSTAYKSRTSPQQAPYKPPLRKKSSNFVPASYTPPPRDENAPGSYAPQPRPNPRRAKPSYDAPASYTPPPRDENAPGSYAPQPRANTPSYAPSYDEPTNDTYPDDDSYDAPENYTPPPRDDSAPASYAPQPRVNPPSYTPSYYAPENYTPPPRDDSAPASYAPQPRANPPRYTPTYDTTSYDLPTNERHVRKKHCPKSFHFYAGMVGGIERLNGRRSEGLTETFGGNPSQTSYTSSFRMLANNSTLSFLGGFLWKFPPLPILMGPEFYFGRGNARSTVSDVRPDPAGLNNRLYSTEFHRKFFYGGLIRIGYNFCRDYLISLSLGIDRSQFTTKRLFHLDPVNAPPTVVTRTKGFNGFLFGLGFEKAFKDIIVGIDLKLIQYRRQLTMDSISITTGPAASNFSVRPVMYSAGLRLCYRF